MADVAVVFIDASLVGGGVRSFVAPGPLAKHAGGIAVGFEDFGQNAVVGCVGFLSGPSLGDLGIVAVEVGHVASAPVLSIAANVGVSGVLAGHHCGA